MRAVALALLVGTAGAASARGAPAWLGPPAPARPRRVVSLAPALTATVLALGHGGALVGVTRYDDAPEVAKLPRVGGFLDPSPEAVLAARPDLVLWQTDGGAAAAVRRIAELGVPVLALPIVSVADLGAAVRAIGKALGDAPAGERLAASLEAKIAATRARAKGLPRPRVLFLVGREPLVAAGPRSFPGELVAIAGGENVVTGDAPWPVYPVEKAVAADPDLVIDGAITEPAGQGMNALSKIPAVREGRLARLPDNAALGPGPRVGDALDQLFELLHPRAKKAP